MKNYGRDELWDSATWADLDKEVLDEVKTVRVAQKVFHTEDASKSSGGAPIWVSTAQVDATGADGLFVPEGPAEAFVEVSARFRLTREQVDAEDTLHTARRLARSAAMAVARAEDQIIFRGQIA